MSVTTPSRRLIAIALLVLNEDAIDELAVPPLLAAELPCPSA
jgi:hypothetical protein